MLATDLIALEDRYGAHNYHPLDVVLNRGQGCWVWDVDGRRYLDCLAAYSAVNQGHCHPRLVKVIAEQAARLTLTSRAFRNDQIGPFARELCEVAGYSKVLLMNSGAEAVETALKAVRKWGYKVKGVPNDQAEVIACYGNFSGRTISIVSFSDEPQYRDGFGPFTPGFRLVPYGDPSAVEAAIGPNTVAVLMEPVQGEAGVIIPPHGALRQIREICDNHDVLLIFDEIQSGLGRTGRMFAWQHEDARPDGITLGKALSGGMMPVSAFLADDQLMEVFHPGDHDNVGVAGLYFHCPDMYARHRRTACLVDEFRGNPVRKVCHEYRASPSKREVLHYAPARTDDKIVYLPRGHPGPLDKFRQQPFHHIVGPQVPEPVQRWVGRL